MFISKWQPAAEQTRVCRWFCMGVYNRRVSILAQLMCQTIEAETFTSKTPWLAFFFKKLCPCSFSQQISWNKNLPVTNTASMWKHQDSYFKQSSIRLYEKFETYFVRIKRRRISLKGLLISHTMIGRNQYQPWIYCNCWIMGSNHQLQQPLQLSYKLSNFLEISRIWTANACKR